MFANDHEAESMPPTDTMRYPGMRRCQRLCDAGTAGRYLGEEDGHIDDIEKVQDQIQQMVFRNSYRPRKVEDQFRTK